MGAPYTAHPDPWTDILALAAAVVERRVGVVEGAREIACRRLTVDPDQKDVAFLALAGVESQTDDLFLGPDGWAWPAAVLDGKGAEIAAAELVFQDVVVDACRILLARYWHAA